AALASRTPALPQALQIVDASATARFSPVGVAGDQRVWELRIDGFSRNHERVDAVYDMVLVLPLPAGPDGRDAFQPVGRGVAVEEGPPDKSVPLIYGGEKIVLKRNVGLEKTLLAGLVGSGRGATGLPDLAGSGYHWTAWDAIVARDDGYGDAIEARARLRYRTPASTTAPDAGDPRLAAYLITWIPALPATIPPYAVRIEVGPPARYGPRAGRAAPELSVLPEDGAPDREPLLPAVRCPADFRRARWRGSVLLHASAPGGSPRAWRRARRRAQARDGADRGCRGISGDGAGARPRGSARADGRPLRARARRRARRARHAEPIPRRRLHGAVRRSRRETRPRAARGARRARDPTPGPDLQ